MKRQLQSLLAISASVTCGLIASAALSGCQPPSPPPTAKPRASSNTTDATPAAPAAQPAPAAESAPEAPKPAEAEASQAAPKENEGAKAPQPNAEAKPAEPPIPATDSTTLAVSTDLELPTENPVLSKGDWSQWGGNSTRNNVPEVESEQVPTDWAPGEFDRETGAWDKSSAKNIKWVAPLGSQTYGNTVVAEGRVYVGTNNGAGYLKRYPSDIDLGCLLAFDEKDGSFLWQDSSEKLPTGRVHDWPLMGICCSPLAEEGKVWFVTSRGEVKCLDADGFYDGTDDGKVKNELARLFDIVRADDAAQDQVAPAIKDLDAGKLPESFRERFTSAGFELPENVTVAAKEAGKSWTLTAEVGGSSREVRFTLQGPRLAAFKVVTPDDKQESDTLWSVDMMRQLGTSQHNMCSCSVTSWGDLLFVNTSNGVHEDHKTIPAPEAPSFVCMNKNTGELYWTDNAPGANILHGQWSSPAVAIIDGVPQVIFGGGDGWVYSYRADAGKDGKGELLWRFDINEKEALLELGGRGTKNDIIATPVVYDNKVYFATGQDPEHGEGKGIFWCIDPTKRGDISETLAVNVADPSKPIPVKRVQSVVEKEGDRTVPNPNSGVVWKLTEQDWDGNGEVDDFMEKFHRGIGTAAIKDDLLFVADFSGLFFCIDAQTGKVHWAHDMLAASWGSALIASDKVFVGDEDGDILVFNLSKEPHDPLSEINMGNSVYSSPVMANGVLYIANKDHLFAIANESESEGEAAAAAE
jgi:outer membrane protein assembly factor BamB